MIWDNPIVCNSYRDYYLLSAKIENFYNSDQNSISVLPINLSLKSYLEITFYHTVIFTGKLFTTLL